MSDILIRNIKMPKNCLECPCFQFEWFDDDIDGYCKALKTKIINRSKHHPDCPLIELPPHGRLADLDQMVEDYWDGNHMEIDEGDLKAISQYKVVIEAEGET